MHWQSALFYVLAALAVVCFGYLFAGLLVRLITRWADYKTDTISILGRPFKLVELTAQQRVEYMKRCAGIGSSDGYELIRDDLSISADLIAMHLRHSWWPSSWVLFWVKRLSVETIAQLFKRCVTLSNIPFNIVEEDQTDSIEAANDSDDWDYIEEEKKPNPAVRP